MVGDMGDPLEPLFGRPALDLLRSRDLRTAHGPLERLPSWMRTGALSGIAELCREHRGPLQAAQGRTRSAPTDEGLSFVGEGGQTPVSGTSAAALLRLGLSVHLANLENTVPEARMFLRAVENALGLDRCLSLSAFINAPGSGLPLHHDSFDQLLINLVGDKSVTIIRRRDVDHPRHSYSPTGPIAQLFGPVYRDGFSDSTSLSDADFETVSLQPGSCVFLPAGTWHRTEDQVEPCLSLSLAVRAASRLDLLMAALTSYLSQSPQWRAPVYGCLHGEIDESEQTNMSNLLTDLRARLPLVDLPTMRQAHHIARIEPGSIDAFPTAETFGHYIRLPSSSLELTEDADSPELFRVSIRIFAAPTPSVLLVDGEARPIIEWIATTRRAFSLAELGSHFEDFHVEDLKALVTQLAQVGFLMPVLDLQWT